MTTSAAAKIASAVKELNGVWAIDGFWGEKPYITGAFVLKDGTDGQSVVSVTAKEDGSLAFAILGIDLAKNEFALTKQPDGSLLGTVVNEKRSNVTRIVLRRVDPPKDAEPLRVSALVDKWIQVPGYLEVEFPWEFRSGSVVKGQYYAKPGTAVKVKDGVVQIDHGPTLYPVYIPAEKLGEKPKLVEFRGIYRNRWTRFVRAPGGK